MLKFKIRKTKGYLQPVPAPEHGSQSIFRFYIDSNSSKTVKNIDQFVAIFLIVIKSNQRKKRESNIVILQWN